MTEEPMEDRRKRTIVEGVSPEVDCGRFPAADLDRSDSLREYVARVNGIRRANRALQRNDTLVFHFDDFL